MGFVEIVSLGILLLVGVAGLIQGVATLAGRMNVRETAMPRWLVAVAYLGGGLAALVVGGLWLFSL